VRTIGLDVGDRLESESTRHSQAGCNSDSTAFTVNAHLAISTVSCLMDIRATVMHGNEAIRDVRHRLVLAATRGGRSQHPSIECPKSHNGDPFPVDLLPAASSSSLSPP
jgi:hypothetical protein